MSKKLLFGLLFQLSLFGLNAQDGDSLGTARSVEIAGIRVSGNHATDEAALLSVAGLRVGDRIRIPGMEISRALKNLLKLGLFSDVQILEEKTPLNSQEPTSPNVVFLKISVKEQARLSGHSFRGLKKSRQEDLNKALEGILPKGNVLTENMKARATSVIEDYFLEKGFADARVSMQQVPDGAAGGDLQLIFDIHAGKKIRVARIALSGNENEKSRKLRKLLPVKPRRKFWKSSKFLSEEWAEGKKAILQHYRTLGFLDAAIAADSVFRNEKGEWELSLCIEEGRRYYFGEVSWKGHSKYSEEQLGRLLGIKPGEPYNPERLEQRLRFSPQGDDISSLYLDDGYLFFQVESSISSIRGDTLDLDIRLHEGTQATVEKVSIEGNQRTKEEVIRRELYTAPGKKFSRADLIRSQRQIANLGFFNPEKLDIRTEVHPERGTVDVGFVVEEGNDGQKFEIAAGWGGKDVGLTGTLGVTFNNFSLRDLPHPASWSPFPAGDGQSLSVRLQSNGKAYQSLNFSFTEPWLGGKRPNSLTFASFFNRYTNGLDASSDNFGSFALLGGTLSLGTRMSWPDDNFVSSTALNFQQYRLNNWSRGLFQTDDGQTVTDGSFYNLNLRQTIARSTINQPIFPTSGSRVSLALSLTPPYSLFSQKGEGQLSQFIEYHKWRFDAESYTPLGKKLVFKASAKIGYLGSYGSASGVSPFERFQIGGDALSNTGGGFTGTDIITLRGYDVDDLEHNLVHGERVPTPLFNKFTMELRYPISLNPSASIYALAFAEAGNSYRNARSYNPFDLKRSAGLGLRVHLPMFGTLGFDYGYGFDHATGAKGRFNVVLGVELD